MAPDYGSNSAAERVERLRERIGTSSKALERRKIFNEYLLQHNGRLPRADKLPRADFEEFETSLNDLGARLQLADLSSLSELLEPGPEFVGDGESLRVFGPDDYVIATGHAEGAETVVVPTNLGWRANPADGSLWASQFVTVDNRLTWAVLGANFLAMRDGFLSVRPYIRWDGFDVTTQRKADPDSGEAAWATTIGQLGIYIGSYKPGVGLWHEDLSYWFDVWYRSEPPSGTRTYQGTETPRADRVLAQRGRRYEIQIGVRAYSAVLPTASIAVGAVASISAKVPYFVVELSSN